MDLRYIYYMRSPNTQHKDTTHNKTNQPSINKKNTNKRKMEAGQFVYILKERKSIKPSGENIIKIGESKGASQRMKAYSKTTTRPDAECVPDALESESCSGR